MKIQKEDFEGGTKLDSIFVEYCLKMFCKDLQLVWCWSKDFNEEEKNPLNFVNLLTEIKDD